MTSEPARSEGEERNEMAGHEYIFKEPFEPTIELTRDGIIESGVYVRRKVVLDTAQDRVNTTKTGPQTEFKASTSEKATSEASPNKPSTSRHPGRRAETEQGKRRKASARQARWRAKKAELLATRRAASGALPRLSRGQDCSKSPLRAPGFTSESTTR
jgi:hypothetical protein